VVERDVWNYMDTKLKDSMNLLREKWGRKAAGSLDTQFKWLQGLPSNIGDPPRNAASQLEYMVSSCLPGPIEA
jgi:hypothetical protein